MKLTTYSVFRARVKLIEEVVVIGGNATIYRYHDKKWWDESQAIVTETTLQLHLNKTFTSRSLYTRPRSQSSCFFYIEQLQSVVVIRCQTALRSSRLEKISSALQQCYQNAKNEFDATHDGLTLLSNRQSFEETLIAKIELLASTPAIEGSETVREANDGLTLLAFDLDHFKQINDNFGHPYGDVVLASFAWRLQTFADELEKLLGSKTYVARLGGEEFQLLLENFVDQEEALKLCGEFGQRLRATPLPSDEEWSSISARRGVALDGLPRASEREISVSIGHAMLTAAEAVLALTSLGAPNRVASSLIQQADVALYRAKSDGRACARAFRLIKDKLGRVLEHHSDTGVVTIDIGSDVGVKNGMEFLVFHPHFFGNHPFYQSDGRTKKKLGTYPKYPSGRLGVFETNTEISFALAIETKQSSVFPAGSRLEYVPLGSITHLLSTPLDRDGGNLASAAQLLEKSKALIDSKARIIGINIAVQDIESIVISKGTAHGNNILASIYRSLRAAFGQEAHIAMNAPAEFVVLRSCEAKVTSDAIRGDIEKLLVDAAASAKCVAGIYDSKLIPINKEKPEMALECARIARSGKGSTNLFSLAIGANAIHQWRAQRSWDEGIADYNRLKSFKLTSGEIENAGGLCFMGRRPNPDNESAVRCFTAAVDETPSDHPLHFVFGRNLASALADSGAYEAALKQFVKYEAVEDDEIAASHQARFARTVASLERDGKPHLDRPIAIKVITRALATGDPLHIWRSQYTSLLTKWGAPIP